MFGIGKKKQTETTENITIVEQPTIPQTPEPEQEIIEDVYEVFQEGIKVHSQPDVFNKDWTLSDLKPNEKYFIRQQIKILTLLKNYIPDETTKTRLDKSLKIDIDSTLILSRSRDGRMVKGLIAFIIGRHEAERLEEENNKQKQGFFSRLFGKST